MVQEEELMNRFDSGRLRSGTRSHRDYRDLRGRRLRQEFRHDMRDPGRQLRYEYRGGRWN